MHEEYLVYLRLVVYPKMLETRLLKELAMDEKNPDCGGGAIGCRGGSGSGR